MASVSWSTIGNETALSQLEKAIVSQAPSHAYLFSGPAFVGKMHAALEFAAALNCREEVRPCRQCRDCRDTLTLAHADVEIVAPGGICDESDHRDHADSRDLRICQVRRLERVLSLTPYRAGRRIAIIDMSDTLRMEAANAFLKTLEEPPEGTIIILLSDREEQLPETVLSRCQKVLFQRVDREVVTGALVARGAEPDAAETIAATSGGRPGWAFRALAEPGLMAERDEVLDTIVRLAHAGRMDRFSWAKRNEETGNAFRERFQRELQVWESWWRDVLSMSAASESGFANSDRLEALREESRLYVPAEIVTFLRALIRTRDILKENVDPQLAVENLMLDLPRPRGPIAGRFR